MYVLSLDGLRFAVGRRGGGGGVIYFKWEPLQLSSVNPVLLQSRL